MQFFGSNYAKYDLSEIDDMRESILAAGKTAWEANTSFITAITKTIIDPNVKDCKQFLIIIQLL